MKSTHIFTQCAELEDPKLRAVATWGYIGIYTLPKSGQVNFYGVKMTS